MEVPYICQRCIQRLHQRPRISPSGLRSPRLTRQFNSTPTLFPRLSPSRRPRPSQDVPPELLMSQALPSKSQPTQPKTFLPPSTKTKSQLPLTPSAPQQPSTQAQDPNSFNYYWETLPPNDSQLTKASDFFMKAAAPPRFLTSIAKFRMFPESDVPEVAFVGRSNVGKSSLLNAMVNANIKEILARTSKTPGCTKTMNLYGVGGIRGGGGVRIKKGNGQFDRVSGRGGLVIVDLPGYGEGSHQEWGAEIMKYLSKRRQLRRVFVLISAKEGVMPSDEHLLAALREHGVPHQVLLSKLDKIYVPSAEKLVRVASRQGGNAGKAVPKGNVGVVRKKMQDVREQIQGERGGGALGELLGVSSEVAIDRKRLGMDAVRVAVLRAVGLV